LISVGRCGAEEVQMVQVKKKLTKSQRITLAWLAAFDDGVCEMTRSAWFPGVVEWPSPAVMQTLYKRGLIRPDRMPTVAGRAALSV